MNVSILVSFVLFLCLSACKHFTPEPAIGPLALPEVPLSVSMMEVSLAKIEHGNSDHVLDEDIGYIAQGHRWIKLFKPKTRLPASFSDRFFVQSGHGVQMQFMAISENGKRRIGIFESTNLNRGPGKEAIPYISLSIHILESGQLIIENIQSSKKTKLGEARVIRNKKKSTE